MAACIAATLSGGQPPYGASVLDGSTHAPAALGSGQGVTSGGAVEGSAREVKAALVLDMARFLPLKAGKSMVVQQR